MPYQVTSTPLVTRWTPDIKGKPGMPPGWMTVKWPVENCALAAKTKSIDIAKPVANTINPRQVNRESKLFALGAD